MPKKIKITLALTEVQWAEVASALNTKAIDISQGRYDFPNRLDDDEDAQALLSWAKTLNEAEDVIEKALKKAGVTW